MDVNKFWHNYFGVVNLSDRTLDIKTLSVLGKGLKFCPTPPLFDHGKLKESIDKFFRSASLKLFFEDKESPEDIINTSFLNDEPFEHKDLKLPSKFNPQRPSTLDYIYNVLIDRVLSFNPTHGPRNLTSEEYKIIDKLSEDENIVIKKADKGSNIVIMNRKDYIEEGLRQLGDTKFYKSIETDISATHRQEVQNLIKEMYEMDEISEKTYLYLSEGGNRTSIFYMLPKIHKKMPPPGRPIVSSVDCPTEKISKLLDIILQPYVLQTKSYIRDTSDFIN